MCIQCTQLSLAIFWDFYKKEVLVYVNTQQSFYIWLIDSNHDSTFVNAYFELPYNKYSDNQKTVE